MRQKYRTVLANAMPRKMVMKWLDSRKRIAEFVPQLQEAMGEFQRFSGC
jgi:hypothetical protein